MNAKTELINYLQHYGMDGITAIIEHMEKLGYTIELSDDEDMENES